MAKNDMSSDRWGPVDQPFETEDEDLCPLCMEELDISDLNFRPCPCGYRICRFCWHHIKEDLNRRCPGCRKEYDDSVVEFKPMKAEELKRFQQAKKQREKERKELESANRKHLANVRVKQKNQVHVQGLTTKIANEDTLVQLKSSELFSQYGRIQKMFMSRRTGPTTLYTPDPRYQHVNLYINFTRNNEAMACIQGLDGTTLPDGHRLKASLGSTKYCSSFLRGIKCPNDNCTCAHELAEEVDTSGGVTGRDELSHLRHTPRDSDSRIAAKTGFHHAAQPSSSNSHAMPSGVALPATASWAAKSSSTSQPASPATHPISLPHQTSSNGLVISKPNKGVIHSAYKSTQNISTKPRQVSPEDTKSNLVGNIHLTTSSASQLDPSTAKRQTSRDSTNRGSDIERKHLDNLNTESSSNTAVNSETSDAQGSSAITSRGKSSIGISHLVAIPPPGLGSHPPGLGNLSVSGSISRVEPSLPPGLAPLGNSLSDEAFTRKTALYNSRHVQGNKPITEFMTDEEKVLSNFSPNFDAPFRISASGCASESILGSLSLTPSIGYSGTFNPFADTDFPICAKLMEDGKFFASQLDKGNSQAENHLCERRGSRFGFARRSSSGAGVNPSGVTSSPLRSIFSHQSADPESSHAINKHALDLSKPQTLSNSQFQDATSHLITGTAENATPDASVLFPGVNLAASYSANALPAVLARGARSPGILTSGAHHGLDSQLGQIRPVSSAQVRDSLSVQAGRVNDRLPFGNRPAALSPTSLNNQQLSGHNYDHIGTIQSARERRLDINSGNFSIPGQFPGIASELGSEFQDPAILNMRMANSSNNGYGAPPLLQSGEAGHVLNEIYPPFSMNTGIHGL
ncbi:hypothetical protein BY996DRAFT_4561987, partial [Phakopsora pachyrhizi]